MNICRSPWGGLVVAVAVLAYCNDAFAQRTEPLPAVLPPPADSSRPFPRRPLVKAPAPRPKVGTAKATQKTASVKPSAPKSEPVKSETTRPAPPKHAPVKAVSAKPEAPHSPPVTQPVSAPVPTPSPTPVPLATGPAVARPVQIQSATAKTAPPNAESLAAPLESAIRRAVRTGKRPLQIEIEAGPQAQEGIFSSVKVEGRPAWAGNIEISALWLHARNAQFDQAALKAGRLQPLSGQVAARLVITEENMTGLLARHPQTAGMNFRARIVNQSIEISGRSTDGLVRGDVRLIGKLTVQGGNLGLRIDTLYLNGSVANPLVKALAQAQVNSALKVDSVPFKPVFKSVTYKQGQVVVST